MICQLKSNKKIDGDVNVYELADTVKYRKVKIKVWEKEKVYFACEQTVEIPSLGEVKLVLSKRRKDKEPDFYMSTNLTLTMKEVLEIYENRWSIELVHREANQKFGFKEYQMRDKKAIERFMQLSFLAWAIILIAKVTGIGHRLSPPFVH